MISIKFCVDWCNKNATTAFWQFGSKNPVARDTPPAKKLNAATPKFYCRFVIYALAYLPGQMPSLPRKNHELVALKIGTP